MFSQYLPSSQLYELTSQFNQIVEIQGQLPSDISDLSQTLEGCIFVDLDDPDASVVSAGLDNGGHKAISALESEIYTVGTNLEGLKDNLQAQIRSIFSQYVSVMAHPLDEDPKEDPQEQFEAFIEQDLASISVYDWKDSLEIIPPGIVLSEIFTRWTPEQAQKFQWWTTIEKKMSTPHAVCQAVIDSFNRGREIDPSWREYILKDISKGYESQKRLAEMAGNCAMVYALKVPNSGFMGWTHKQWYTHIRSLDIEPKFTSAGVGGLLRYPDKVKNSTPDTIQKLIMGRFRRLMFLDPEVAKKSFSIFAPGERVPQSVNVVIPSQESKDTKAALSAAFKAVNVSHNSRHSLGQTLANVFLGLDQTLQQIDQPPQRSYSDLFQELRAELQIGRDVLTRLEKTSTTSPPKM